MAEHTLDIAAFRAAYPMFTDPPYTDAFLNAQWLVVTCLIDDMDSCALSGECLQQALYLMLAHVAWLTMSATGGGGGIGGVKTSATIDKVSVTVAAPPFKDGWQYWLGQTPFGLQLWALLSAKSAGGWYFGGLPEGDAIRKVYGVF